MGISASQGSIVAAPACAPYGLGAEAKLPVWAVRAETREKVQVTGIRSGLASGGALGIT